jgi:urease accessory protein UreE
MSVKWSLAIVLLGVWVLIGSILVVGSKNVVSFLVIRGCFGLGNAHVSVQVKCPCFSTSHTAKNAFKSIFKMAPQQQKSVIFPLQQKLFYVKTTTAINEKSKLRKNG